MSSKEYLTEAATRHQVFLQRYAAGQSKQAIRGLNRLRNLIKARLAQEPTRFQSNRLMIILQDIDIISSNVLNSIADKTVDSVKELAVSESEFSVKLFNKATINTNFTLPAEAALFRSVFNANMSVGVNSGLTIEEAFKQFNFKKKEQIARVISDGVTLGDTNAVISKNLDDMINTLQRRHIDTLVRTVTNHTSSVARRAVFEANSDIIDGYRWISTLDNSTTLICGSRDQQLYQAPYGPMPPAHWNCRSTTIPVVKPEFDIGSDLTGARPSVGSDGAKVLPSRTTYGGWLKKQPKVFVDEALGVERSKLFRSGKYKIGDFIDPTGKTYKLSELQAFDDLTF